MTAVRNPAAPSTATTIFPVGTANSSGTFSYYAQADHAHLGLQNIALGGNTVGNTTNAATIILQGGNNVTLSGTSAPGGMTVTISAGGVQPLSTSSALLTPINIAYSASSGTMFTGSSMYISPFLMSRYMTISAINPILFSYSLATTTATTGSRTSSFQMNFAIYSVDSTGSSYINVGSGSFSKGITITNSNFSSQFYTGIRTTSISLNSTITVSSGGTYALAFCASQSSSIAGNGILTVSSADYTYGDAAFTAANTNTFFLTGPPRGLITFNTTGFPASISTSALTITSSASAAFIVGVQ